MDHMDQNEELYRAWIGVKNQEKYYRRMKKGGFNLCAFFFRELLYLTRKMFVETILLIIAETLIVIALSITGAPEGVYSLVGIILSTLIGVTYYPLYRWSIERKIKYYQRKGLTYEQQLEIARKRGGDKVNVAVILMLVVLIMIYATIYIIFEGSNKTDIISQSKQDSNNEEINKESDINTILNTSSTEEKNNTGYGTSSNEERNNTNYGTSSTENNKKMTWFVSSLKLTYNPNNWEVTTFSGNSALKHKDSSNQLIFLAKESSNDSIREAYKNTKNQKNFEYTIKEKINSMGAVSYSYATWQELNKDIIICKVKCTPTNTNVKGIVNYYYYITNHNVYGFMTVAEDENYTFEYEAKEVMDTIKDNSPI